MGEEGGNGSWGEVVRVGEQQVCLRLGFGVAEERRAVEAERCSWGSGLRFRALGEAKERNKII